MGEFSIDKYIRKYSIMSYQQTKIWKESNDPDFDAKKTNKTSLFPASQR
jgi:hypothetical protein